MQKYWHYIGNTGTYYRVDCIGCLKIIFTYWYQLILKILHNTFNFQLGIFATSSFIFMQQNPQEKKNIIGYLGYVRTKDPSGTNMRLDQAVWNFLPLLEVALFKSSSYFLVMGASTVRSFAYGTHTNNERQIYK